jgi:hypothetical protein
MNWQTEDSCVWDRCGQPSGKSQQPWPSRQSNKKTSIGISLASSLTGCCPVCGRSPVAIWPRYIDEGQFWSLNWGYQVPGCLEGLLLGRGEERECCYLLGLWYSVSKIGLELPFPVLFNLYRITQTCSHRELSLPTYDKHIQELARISIPTVTLLRLPQLQQSKLFQKFFQGVWQSFKLPTVIVQGTKTW